VWAQIEWSGLRWVRKLVENRRSGNLKGYFYGEALKGGDYYNERGYEACVRRIIGGCNQRGALFRRAS